MTFKKGPAFFLTTGIFAHCILLVSIRLYPFLDIPNHLAIAAIFKYYGSAGTCFDNYFSLELFPKPNIIHMLISTLPVFPSVESGNKAFYCLYTVLYPLSVVVLVWKCKGNQWFSVLVFLLLYNLNATYGFTGFTIAIPFVLFTLFCTIEYLISFRLHWACAVTLLLLSLFFMHALAAVYTIMLFCICCLFAQAGVMKKAVSLWPVLPACALILVWWLQDSSSYSAGALAPAVRDYFSNRYFSTFYHRFGFFVHDNFRLFGGMTGYGVAACFSMLIIFSSLAAVYFNRRTLKKTIRLQRCRFVIVFLISTGVFVLFLPDRLPGYSYLFQRFSVLLLTAFIIAGGIFCRRRLDFVVVMLFCSACCIHFVLWSECFVKFNKENQGFDETFFSDIKPDAIMASFVYNYRFRDVSVYENFADYFTVWNKGIAVTRLYDERSFVIRRKASKDKLPVFIEWIGKRGTYDGRYANVDYMLVRGDCKQSKESLGNFYLFRKNETWELYKNSKKE